MDSKRSFKILSIDGGGIKGLFSAVILSEFEQKYGNVKNHFDLVCGTSTGGIIALALAAGIPANRIVKLYSEKGPLIFPYKNGFIRAIHWFKQAVIKSKYNDLVLRNSIQEIFKDKTISDCKTKVLIPTANITKGTPCVIKPDDHNSEFSRDNNHRLVDVALSTSAAPTYFPVQEIPTMPDPEDQFVDGGLWANNPSLLGLQEAYRFFINDKEKYDYDNFSLLSIATLHQNFSYQQPLKIRKRSFVLWNSKLLSLMLDLQSISTHNHIKYLNNSLQGHYVRIQNEDALSKKEQKMIDLDLASNQSIELLIKKAKRASQKWIEKDEIMYFFKDQVS
jgi:patatin-like phospholipase/acyl hydrolase